MRNKTTTSTIDSGDIVFEPLELEHIDASAAVNILAAITSLLLQLQSNEELPVIV